MTLCKTLLVCDNEVRPRPAPVVLTLHTKGVNMRIRRFFRSVSAFLTHLGGALFKVLVTCVVLGVVVVSIMHYMGVPVPSAHDLLRELGHLVS